MKKALPELTVRYEPRTRRFVVIANNKGNPFSITWPVDELRTHRDLGERAIGAAVLAFFDRVCEGGIGLKNYRSNAERDESKLVKDLQRLAKKKDAAAQYSLAMLLLRRAAKQKSLKDVEDAEKWLNAAAKAGSKAALSYLEASWFDEKEVITHRIKSR